MKPRKVLRNAPCPCGSRKKYKNCCFGRKGRAAAQAAAAAAAAPQRISSDKAKLPSETKHRAATVVPRFHLPGPWYQHIAVILLLTILTSALYWGDLQLGFFHLDDDSYVIRNPWIRDITFDKFWHILTVPYFANYTPMHNISYMVDFAINGLNAEVFHWSNNIWGGMGAGMVYLLALALTSSRPVAVAAGLLFVAHPSHVEAVAWISSRKDLVALTFALPALLTWLLYLDESRNRKLWYTVSVLLFTLAIAGKQSVVVVPALGFVYEWFALRRRDWRMWFDKLPFVIITAWFAIKTMGAQPSTRHNIEMYVLGIALLKNLWLLTGFGEYVLYRLRPDPDMATWLRAVFGGCFIAAFVLPFVLRRWLPAMVLVFVYWLLLALLPPQILSFVHPVTDRYLYFPSALIIIFLTWGLFIVVKRLGTPPNYAAVAILAVIAAGWTWKTLAYMEEWRDPRSVWYAASQKSQDPNVFLYLGCHYQDAADNLPSRRQAGGVSRDAVQQLAEYIWRDDERRAPMLKEWEENKLNGTATRAYQAHLRDLAWALYDEAIKTRVKRTMPNLYYRRGKIEMDRGNRDHAMREFQEAYEVSKIHTSVDVRQSLEVMCNYAMGITAWQERNYEEALRLIRFAEAAQQRYGGNWVPEVSQSREKLEGLVRIRD